MLFIFFSILPFLVCFCWLLAMLCRGKRLVFQQRILAVFALVCSALYLCHAGYFNSVSNLLFESIWTFCSLASYPLYLIYLLSITSGKDKLLPRLHFVLPAFSIALLRYFVAQPWVDLLRQIVFVVSVLITAVYGLFQLVRFEKSIQNTYSDLENRSTRPIQLLLVCFVVTSILSVVFDVIGKKAFLNDTLLIAVPSILFSVMLFLVFLIGNKYTFSFQKMEDEISDEGIDDAESIDDHANLGLALRVLMDEQQLYLKHDLKLPDLAREVGTCRTYLSSYLNNEIQMSFSDYINSQRIKYARELRNRCPEMSEEEVADQSGFSSLITYKRNLMKFQE